jgi:hypothetical protein
MIGEAPRPPSQRVFVAQPRGKLSWPCMGNGLLTSPNIPCDEEVFYFAYFQYRFYWPEVSHSPISRPIHL